ncbi:MAG: hypothetical protein NXH70_02545 [Hyphomonas sp.]|nr:hypothetical protein [Hyphomonas sp.]
MPVGIEITDDSGNTVINPDMKNFGLIATGQVATNLVIGTANLRYVDITFSGRSSPLLALHGSAWCGLLGVTVSGSTYTWRVVARSGTLIQYWLFDEFATPTETFGLEVFNSGGERIYHSGSGGLRVLGFFSDQDLSQSFTDGTKIAFVQGRPSTVEFLFDNRYPGAANPDMLATVVHGAGFVEDHTINVFYQNFETQAVSGGGVNIDPKPEVLVVDVTNLGPYGTPNPPPDVTPNSVNWSNISTTNSNATSNSQTIAGTDTLISLEITSSNPNHAIKVFVAGSEQPSNIVDVNPNQAVYFVVDNYQATTQGGTITVTNKTDGDKVLDTFTCSLGPTADITPNAVNWNNYSNLGVYTYTTPTQTISGLAASQSIDIEVYSSQTNFSIVVLKNGVFSANPGSFQNGDTLSMTITQTNQLAGASGPITVRNNTDSNTILDTFNVTLGPFDLGGLD